MIEFEIDHTGLRFEENWTEVDRVAVGFERQRFIERYT